MKSVECQHLLGISHGTLTDCEKGKRMPKRERHKKINSILRYDPFRGAA